jgi:hypothetical protein
VASVTDWLLLKVPVATEATGTATGPFMPLGSLIHLPSSAHWAAGESRAVLTSIEFCSTPQEKITNASKTDEKTLKFFGVLAPTIRLLNLKIGSAGGG